MVYFFCLWMEEGNTSWLWNEKDISESDKDDTSRLWNTKHISGPDKYWFVTKRFKTKWQILPIDEQRKIIEKKKLYFWEYIPETHLIETENWEYIIRQKYIKWKTLANTDISSLSVETLRHVIDLIKKYLHYYKKEWWELDLTWYQFYEWNPNFFVRKIKNFLRINQNFLASTNIMIDDDWNVYIVDVCESSNSRLPWKIKNFFAKPFIKRTISLLEETLKKRINFENSMINWELIDTLNS